MARGLASIVAVLAVALTTAGTAIAAGTRDVAGTAGAAARAASTAATAPSTTATAPSTPASPTTPATPAKPKPVKASLRIYLPDLFFVNRHPVTVPGRRLHVGGVIRPYVPGQWVTVRAFIGRRLVKSARVRLRRSHNGRYGRFSVAISVPRVGNVMVRVAHHRNAEMLGFLGHRSFAVLDERIGFGSTGRFVQLIQQRLAALHFYIPQTGVYDGGTGLAIDAYHRLLHWGTYQTLDGRTISFLLDGFGAFPVRYPGDGHHAEGNLGLQLVALIDRGQVQAIYPISSGKPSTPTILGRFRVYSKVPGYLPDGMYDSNFFYGGYAIHGYDPAPDYPASHGCMRLPIPDASSVFSWLRYGDGVDVYY